MTEMHAVVTRAECCEGWADLGRGLGCEPQCDGGCGGGRCHAPGQCLCQPGHTGPRCELRRITTTLPSTSTTTTTTDTTTSTATPRTTPEVTTTVELLEESGENSRKFDVENTTVGIVMTADKFAMRTEQGEMGPILSSNLLIGILATFAFLFVVSVVLTSLYFR